MLICCQVMRWRVVSRLVPREDIPRPPPSATHPASSHPPLSTLRLQTHQLEMIPREARTQPPPASEPHTHPPVTSVTHKYFPPNLNAQFTCVLYTRTFLCLANIFCVVHIYSIYVSEIFLDSLKISVSRKNQRCPKNISGTWKIFSAS